MKNLLFIVFVASLFATGCKPKDTQPPMIFLNGANPMTVILNSWWRDPGVTVDDNRDGASLLNAVVVTHNIEINGPANGEGTTKLAGPYLVTYSVKDKSGNQTSITRTVNVVNSQDVYATKYSLNVSTTNASIIHDTNVVVDLTVDQRVNNKIWFSKLGAKSGFRVFGMVKAGAVLGTDTIDVTEQFFAFNESAGRRLYSIKGVANQSLIVDPDMHVKYSLTQYRYDSSYGNVHWPLGSDSTWTLVHQDIITDTYIRY